MRLFRIRWGRAWRWCRDKEGAATPNYTFIDEGTFAASWAEPHGLVFSGRANRAAAIQEPIVAHVPGRRRPAAWRA
jgi:hypothetical protein